MGYFTRPVPGLSSPILIHANWIGGVAEKIYHMRESGLWIVSPPGGHEARRFLSVGDWIDKGPEGPAGIAVHRRALRDALTIADALNRTLVLPRLPVTRAGLRRRYAASIAHHFDYGALAHQFPNIWVDRAGVDRQADATVRVHIDIGRGDEPPPEAGFTVVRARTRIGLTDKGIRRRLAPFAL